MESDDVRTLDGEYDGEGVRPVGELGLLNSDEVAAMIRVPTATLRYWRHIGIGPRSFKMGPRRVLYRAVDLDAWVAAQYADQR